MEKGKKKLSKYLNLFFFNNKHLSSVEKTWNNNNHALFFRFTKSRSSFPLFPLFLSLPGHHILPFPSFSWWCRFDSAFPDVPNSLLLTLSASLADGCWGGSRDAGLAWSDWLDTQLWYVMYLPIRLPFVLWGPLLGLSPSPPWMYEPAPLRRCAGTYTHAFSI